MYIKITENNTLDENSLKNRQLFLLVNINIRTWEEPERFQYKNIMDFQNKFQFLLYTRINYSKI